MKFVRPTRVILEHLRNLGDLDAGIADRLASREGFEFRQRFCRGQHGTSDGLHDPAARGSGQLGPLGLPDKRSCCGLRGNRCAGIGISKQQLPSDRIIHRDPGAGPGDHRSADVRAHLGKTGPERLERFVKTRIKKGCHGNSCA